PFLGKGVLDLIDGYAAAGGHFLQFRFVGYAPLLVEIAGEQAVEHGLRNDGHDSMVPLLLKASSQPTPDPAIGSGMPKWPVARSAWVDSRSSRENRPFSRDVAHPAIFCRRPAPFRLSQ